MDYIALLNKAKTKIELLPVGERFEVKSLFQGVDWEKVSVGQRRSFGKFFSNEVDDGKVSHVRKIGKASNNHMQYEKM